MIYSFSIKHAIDKERHLLFLTFHYLSLIKYVKNRASVLAECNITGCFFFVLKMLSKLHLILTMNDFVLRTDKLCLLKKSKKKYYIMRYFEIDKTLVTFYQKKRWTHQLQFVYITQAQYP